MSEPGALLSIDPSWLFPPALPAEVAVPVAGIRACLVSDERPANELVGEWRRVLSSSLGFPRRELEMILLDVAVGDLPKAIIEMRVLAETARDFVLLAIQDLPTLQDPLEIPQPVRSVLRERMRPWFAATLTVPPSAAVASSPTGC